MGDVVDASTERRLDLLERENERLHNEAVRLAELAADERARLVGVEREVGELKGELTKTRQSVWALVMVLVGFAFTVAGSAVVLNLTLNGSPA